MSYVFGPVPSRRLGLSLGVDLIPPKTCTFDCLYCQVGRTLCKTLDEKSYVPVRDVIVEIKKNLLKSDPDVITLAGSGEPTLHSEIDQVIDSIKEMTDIKVAVLTNGSLLWRKEVRSRVLMADIIMPTLSSAIDHTFRRIHRPHGELDLGSIIDGLKTFSLMRRSCAKTCDAENGLTSRASRQWRTWWMSKPDDSVRSL